MKNSLKYVLAYGFLAAVLVYIWSKNSVKAEPVRPSKKIIIGDSHAVGIGIASGVEVDKRIAVGGWMLSTLLNALKNYPVRTDVGTVIVSIGTNGQFSSSDKIEELVILLHQKFPNAKIYAFKGSYGWSGTRTTQQTLDRLNPYYQRFQKAGVTIMQNGLGYFSTDASAHSVTSPQAQAIIKEIKQI